MAKGGNNKRSNSSRFSKPYDVSNSFVTKVASRVSDYFGGWFNTSKTSETSSVEAPDKVRRPIFENLEVKESSTLSNDFFTMENIDTTSAKRIKICEKEKVNIDFPISPIPSTSGLLQININHNNDISKNESYMRSTPNPIGLSNEAYLQTNVSSHPTATVDIKSNGAIDNHSDSSESTSGCSSLVPQSDRLSQSAYHSTNSRKRNLEEKLKYARQLQQSRAAMFLNRSIPNNFLNVKKKPSFDITAYKTVSMDKSFLREKFNNSPFYTGQTSYGGASAYKNTTNSLYAHKGSKSQEAIKVQVKPSCQGSTEDLTNMSHTAKKILEALEQFSTPISDAKRIPVSKLNSLGLKRQRMNDLSETKLRLSKPMSPLNPSPGPVIAALNVPTVPDLLKLKRLERIQNSTAAARQVASEKQEYTLQSDSKTPLKRTGKMVTKLKNREKDIILEKPEQVSLPAIPLPITTLPKFDFKLPPLLESATCKTEEPTLKHQFKFSAPIPVSSTSANVKQQIVKSDFTFSNPLDTTTKNISKDTFNFLPNVTTNDGVDQPRHKPVNDSNFKPNNSKTSNESVQNKTENVSNFFSENVKVNTDENFHLSYTWECNNCFIRNLNDNKVCCGCKCERILENKLKNSSNNQLLEKQSQEATCSVDFGDKFKPPSGSWNCKECYVNNKENASKCVACETPKSGDILQNKFSPPEKISKPCLQTNGFGDKFKKQADQWECSACMLLNLDSATKCVACETPKSGKKAENTDLKFSFGSKPEKGSFTFGIDKSDVDSVGVKSVADSSTFKNQSNSSNSELLKSTNSQFNTITTSVGVFTFGIPPVSAEAPKEQPSNSKDNVASNSRFQVTSTSGFGARQEEPSILLKNDEKEKNLNCEKGLLNTKNLFGTINDSSKSLAFEPCKNSSNVFAKESAEENKVVEPENKNAKLFFGLSSEAVSSSTVDSTFGQKKSETSVPALSQSNATTFQFNSLGPSESSTTKLSSNMSVEINKPENKFQNSVSVAANMPPIFSSISSSNETAPKIAFPIAATANSNLVINDGNSASSPYASLDQPFPSSNINSQNTMKETLTNSCDITPQQIEKPVGGNCGNFGTGLFTNTINPFASTFNSAKPVFGATEQNPISNFSNNPTPAFGEPTFIQSSNEINKPAQPFIFGASPSSVTCTSTSGPNVFTFGASKQETKPSVFTFGQSGGPSCTFESNAQTSNLFGNFSQVKSDTSIGVPGTIFGNSAPTFGQNTAPASFESTAPKFEFGTSSTQQMTPGLFQFGAVNAPSSAPTGTNFSLSVPQKFNFSTGLPSVLGSESQSAIRSDRKVIRAVRRTNPRRTN